MSCSNNYKLECFTIKNAKLYKLFQTLSLILKFLAVFSLIVLFWLVWFFIISIALYVIGGLLSYFASKMTYNYEYSIDDGKLKVVQVFKNNKEITLLNTKLDEITECKLLSVGQVNFESENCFIVKECTAELYLEVIMDDISYYIIGDKYFYSLIMEKK